MRPLQAPLLAALIAMLPLAAAAEPIGYAAGFDTLYRIDLATGRATAVGGIGFNDVEGLAFAQDGTLYGVADATVGSGSGVTDLLIRINPATGAGSLVAPLAGLAGLGSTGNLDYGLAFTCDQRLWLSSDTTNQLWEVTPATGATRFVANTGASLSGLAGREHDLYGLSVGASPTLYRIATDTGATVALGPANVGGVVDDAGLDFDGAGALWATLDPEPAAVGASRFARLDTTTGAGTVIATSSVTQIGMEGLAIAPVPACGTVGGVGNVPVAPIPVPGPGLPMLAILGAFAAAFGLARVRRAGAKA
jgi:hypothetical protein